ncbi:hypothetical protein PMAG_a0733 [Pseudoalteromonas mariniglutinosa NCIMB 1770]|nr:hypothetical protein [Pseudoalteromonas mariniglutinosa NCIMB 1770]
MPTYSAYSASLSLPVCLTFEVGIAEFKSQTYNSKFNLPK